MAHQRRGRCAAAAAHPRQFNMERGGCLSTKARPRQLHALVRLAYYVRCRSIWPVANGPDQLKMHDQLPYVDATSVQSGWPPPVMIRVGPPIVGHCGYAQVGKGGRKIEVRAKRCSLGARGRSW